MLRCKISKTVTFDRMKNGQNRYLCTILDQKKMACCRMRLYAATTSVKNGGIPYGVSLKQDGYMGVYFAQANGKNTARE